MASSRDTGMPRGLRLAVITVATVLTALGLMAFVLVSSSTEKEGDGVMAQALPQNSSEKKKVAILIYEGVELLDFAGPGEVFQVADQGRAYDVYLVGPSTAPIISQNFVTVIPEYGVADAPRADILVIPGGAPGSAFEDEAVMAWIEAEAARAEITLSVCNGALLLGRLGLLDGLQVTTHHAWRDWLEELAPAASLVERRYVDEGRIVTTAGISAGMDGALHVVARDRGIGAAKAAATQMEYRWEIERGYRYDR